MQQHELVGPLDVEARIFSADSTLLVLVDDLVAIVHGHVEGVQDHAMGGVEQRCELLVTAALDNMKLKQRRRSGLPAGLRLRLAIG